MYEDEITSAYLICEQKYLINMVSLGRIFAYSSVLFLQILSVFDIMPID